MKAQAQKQTVMSIKRIHFTAGASGLDGPDGVNRT
jgi:hypothetical protein